MRVLGIALVIASACAAAPAVKPPAPVASARQLDDLRSLVTQDGERFSFEGLKGRTVVMHFIFTHCPMSCPLQTTALASVQRKLPESLRGRVQFVSISVDPVRDTPPVLKDFGSAMGADFSNWSFVTGDSDEIAWLHRYFDARVKSLAGGQFDHRVAVYLIEGHGRVIQRYSGDLDQPRLAREIAEVDRLYNKS
jgi:protein SCO1/2